MKWQDYVAALLFIIIGIVLDKIINDEVKM